MGLTCFIAIMLFVQHEFSYDRFFTNVDRIYRVYQRQEGNVFLERRTEQYPRNLCVFRRCFDCDFAGKCQLYEPCHGPVHQKRNRRRIKKSYRCAEKSTYRTVSCHKPGFIGFMGASKVLAPLVFSLRRYTLSTAVTYIVEKSEPPKQRLDD